MVVLRVIYFHLRYGMVQYCETTLETTLAEIETYVYIPTDTELFFSDPYPDLNPTFQLVSDPRNIFNIKITFVFQSCVVILLGCVL
jgi:hypothetical protein